MIGVITASTTSGSVLGYDFGDKKEKDQRIQILAAEGVFLDPEQVDRLNRNWMDSRTLAEFKHLSRTVANDISQQFDEQATLSDRIVKTTGHIALSFSPADAARLQDEEFRIQLAKDYMDMMGITDTQWVLTWHIGSNAPHGHIAYNRVRFDGSVIDAKNERYRSQKAAREISLKYGLTPAGKAPRHKESLSPKGQEYAQMRTLCIDALAHSYSGSEYRHQLQKRGIRMIISEHSDKGTQYGISYSMGDCTAKGSKLDRNALSFSKIQAALQLNRAKRQQREDTARTVTMPQPTKKTPVAAPQLPAGHYHVTPANWKTIQLPAGVRVEMHPQLGLIVGQYRVGPEGIYVVKRPSSILYYPPKIYRQVFGKKGPQQQESKKPKGPTL
jgi:hypothetical protein